MIISSQLCVLLVCVHCTSTWHTQVLQANPSSLNSGSTTQQPASLLGSVPTKEYHWMYAHWYSLSSCKNEKEQENLSYLKSAGTTDIGFDVYKDTILVHRALSLRWCCLNVFTMYASNATNITWGIKCCNIWIEDMDFAFDDKVHTLHHIGRWYHKIQVKLIKEISLKEDQEIFSFNKYLSLIKSPTFF